MSENIYTHSLVVPIVLDAMCFEEGKSHEIKSGYVNYNQSHPLPKSFEMEQLDSLQTGVHLHWELPNALRHGTHRNGRVEFPKTPNRWLIRRMTKLDKKEVNEKLWLIKSDELVNAPVDNADITLKDEYAKQRIVGTSVPHIKNRGNQNIGQEKYIGVKKGTWKFDDLYYCPSSENNNIELTSVGWLSPHFSSFAPFCRNVFGTIDSEVKKDEVYDYSVIGWFDTPEDDIVFKLPNKDDSLASFLKDSHWKLPSGFETDTLVGVSSYYVGEILNVVYPTNQSNPVIKKAPELIIDTTITTAYTSMFNEHIEDEKLLNIVLNEESKKFDDTAIAAEKKIRDILSQQEFLKENDGYYWVFKTEENQTEKTDESKVILNELLKKVNDHQEKINDIYISLKNERLKLFRKYYTTIVIENSQEEIILSIENLKDNIKSYKDQILTNLKLYEGKFQKIARRPYLEPKDPTLLIKNLLPKDETRMDSLLTIAILKEAIHSSLLDNHIEVSRKNEEHKRNFKNAKRTYYSSNQTIELSNTLQTILDKLKNKSLFEKLEEDTKDTSYTKSWDQNQWSPIFVDYEIEAYDFHMSNWGFDKQNGEYLLTSADNYKTETISESLAITPSIKQLHKDKLQETLLHDNISAIQKSAIQKELEAVEDYDVVTQVLHGLRKHYSNKSTDIFQLPNKQTNRKIYSALFESIGVDDVLPMYALPISLSSEKESDRAGQHFFIKKLIAYDKFGRVLPLITENRFHQDTITKVPQHLQVNNELAINNLTLPFTWELTPKLTLPCKIHVKQSSLNDKFLDTKCIIGFVIVNHFDQFPSLFIYSRTSSFLGEIHLDNNKRIQWSKGPNSNILKIEDLKNESEQLFGFVNSFNDSNLTSADKALYFLKFIREIEALKAYKFPENIRVSDNLQLVGKPIALIEQEYYISTNEYENHLQNEPKQIHFKIGETPEITTKQGELLHTNDGVLGYYKYSSEPKQGYNYTTFYLNDQHQQLPDNYVSFNYKEGKSSSLKTLQLVDPYMTYHVYSGVLPVVTFNFPPNKIASLIENMTFYFKVNYLLTHKNEYLDEHQNKENHQIMPLPNKLFGKWNWQSISDSTNNWMEISDYNEHDNFAETKIETGFLRLIQQDKHE